MDKNFQNRTLVLLILCIFSIVLYASLIVLYIVWFQSIGVFSLIIIVGFIVAAIGIYTKQKYGFISAIITSAFATILYIIALAILELIIVGSILVLAIFEFVDYEKNYQIMAKKPEYQLKINQEPNIIPSQQQDYSPHLLQQSIQDESPKFCPNCGEPAEGLYCRVCGKKID